MTITHPEVADGELLKQVRAGDLDAYGELYRRHERAAYQFARRLAGRGTSADDVVAEAFTRILSAIKNDKGPQESFRPYLFVALRSVAIRHSSVGANTSPQQDTLDGLPDERDGLQDLTDRSLIVEAFTLLPERWRAVLWHVEAEGLSAAEAAPILGLSPNGVSALAYRAREALRQAYLQVHLHAGSALPAACQSVAELLPAHVRDKLTQRQDQTVTQHLDECARCRTTRDELGDVGLAFRTAVGPLAGLGIAGPTFRGRSRSVKVARTMTAAAAIAVAVAGLAVAVTHLIGPSQELGSPAAPLAPSTSPDRASGAHAPQEPPTTAPPDVPESSSSDTITPDTPVTSTTTSEPHPTPGTEEVPGMGGNDATVEQTVTEADLDRPPAPGPPLSPALGDGRVHTVRADQLGDATDGRPAYVLITAEVSGADQATISADAEDAQVDAAEGQGPCPDGPQRGCTVPVGIDGRAQLVVTVAGSGTSHVRSEAWVAKNQVATSQEHLLSWQPEGLTPDLVAGAGMRVTATSAAVARRDRPDRPGVMTAGHRFRLDEDDDPTTSTSSTANLSLPDHNPVRWARLYWAADPTAGQDGTAAPRPAQTDQVMFTAPSGRSQRVVADRVDTVDAAYQASADVTHLIEGSGDYRAADIQMGTGLNGWGAWTLVVAAEDPAMTSGPPTVVSSGLVPMPTNASLTHRAAGPTALEPTPWSTTVIGYEGDAGSQDSLTWMGLVASDPFDSWSTDSNGKRTETPGLDRDTYTGTSVDPPEVVLRSANEGLYVGLIISQRGS